MAGVDLNNSSLSLASIVSFHRPPQQHWDVGVSAGGKKYQDWRKRDHEAQENLHASSSRMKQKQHDELEKLKQDETNIRQQRLPYVPGSNTPHVANLPTLRMHAKALRMWEESLRSHGASSTLDTMRQARQSAGRVVCRYGRKGGKEFGSERRRAQRQCRWPRFLREEY